eukprot:g13389.t1
MKFLFIVRGARGGHRARAARIAVGANATGGPERPRALNVTLASQQIGGQRQRPHWWSLAEVKQTLRNAVRGREVPSAEAMLFTAGLIAAIMDRGLRSRRFFEGSGAQDLST